MKRTSPKSADLTDEIKIYSQTIQDDGYGGGISVRSLYWSTYAEVKPLKPSHFLQANQEELFNVYRVSIRYRSDKTLLKDMQVVWKGMQFVILPLQPDLTYYEYVTFDMKGSDIQMRRAVSSIYFGSVSVLPTTIEQLQELNSTTSRNTANIETGTVNKIFVVAFKEGSIQSVIDPNDDLGGDITAQYTYRGLIGNEFRVWAMEIAVPYSEPRAHIVTIG